MKKNKKKFTIYFISISFVTVALTVSCVIVAFLIDPYRIFSPIEHDYQTSFEPNTRYIKTDFLSRNCRNFDSFILGSSRVIGYKTSDIDKVYGLNSYNFGVSDDTFTGVLQKLKWLKGKGCFPKVVFVEVSLDRLHLRDFSNAEDLLRREHPELTGGSIAEFYKRYILSSAAIESIFKKFESERKEDAHRVIFNFAKGDTLHFWDDDFEIKNCSGNEPIPDEKITNFVSEFEKIADLAASERAELVLLWNPQPISVQMKYSKESIELLLRSLAGHAEFIQRIPLTDSRLYSSANYRDLSHFKDTLGYEVLRKENKVRAIDLLEEFKMLKLEPCSNNIPGTSPKNQEKRETQQ